MKIKTDYGDKPSRDSYSTQITGSSDILLECKRNALRMAKSDAPVLITGESGSGKELFANLIFENSTRQDKPFIKINCAALPESLIETELFGHVRGAFTDAVTERIGKFGAADTGTIFLDEICELPLGMQSRLLRVIETGRIDKLGSDHSSETDVRIIAATNRNIKKEIDRGNFRKDLYYRINVLSLHVPSLSERKSDIPELISHFAGSSGNKIEFDKSAIEKLKNYRWPGNVRELQNYVKKLSVLKAGRIITDEDIDLAAEDNFLSLPLKKAINIFKKNYIIEVLDRNNWNQSKSASVLGIQRTYLSRLLNELDIKDKGKE